MKDIQPLLDKHQEILDTINNNLSKVADMKIPRLSDVKLADMHLKDINKFFNTSISFISNYSDSVSKNINELSKIKFDTNALNNSKNVLKNINDSFKNITRFATSFSKTFSPEALSKFENIDKIDGEALKTMSENLKNLDKFLFKNITYIYKMADQVKQTVEKLGGLPPDMGLGAPPKPEKAEKTPKPKEPKTNSTNILFNGAALSVIRDNLSKVFAIGTSVAIFGKIMLESGTKFLKGLDGIKDSIYKNLVKLWGSEEDSFFSKAFGKVGEKLKEGFVNGIKGIGGVLLGLGGMIFGIIGIFTTIITKALNMATAMQREMIQAAQRNGLTISGLSNTGYNMPTNLRDYYGVGGSEGMMNAKAGYLSRTFGLYGTPNKAITKGIAGISNATGLGTDAISALYDVMQNIQHLPIASAGSDNPLLKVINKFGMFAPKIIKDMTDNLSEFILYGEKAFTNMSEISNRLGFSTKQAINMVEKFSTVSGSIQSSFKLSLLTGNKVNPLEQFMQYAFGDPSKILKNVMDSVGNSGIKDNRLLQKALAETLGISVDQLMVTIDRSNKIKSMGITEEQYNKQFKTLDAFINSEGMQRMFGSLTELFDVLSKTIFGQFTEKIKAFIMSPTFDKFITGLESVGKSFLAMVMPFFDKFTNYVASNGDKIISSMTSLASWVINHIPMVISTFSKLLNAVAFVADNFGKIFGTYLGAAIGFKFGIVSGLVGTGIGFAGGAIFDSMNKSKEKIGDGYVSNGKAVATDPNDVGIFAKTPDGLVNGVMQYLKREGTSTSVSSKIKGEKDESDIKIIKVQSDVTLDGMKVGNGLTEIAFKMV